MHAHCVNIERSNQYSSECKVSLNPKCLDVKRYEQVARGWIISDQDFIPDEETRKIKGSLPSRNNEKEKIKKDVKYFLKLIKKIRCPHRQ